MNKKIWIDLDNSPHVPFFAPIIEELEQRGYRVLVTARNAFQVCELADAIGLKYQCVGHHFGKNKIAKAVGLAVRAAQLIPFIRSNKPDLAVSHGSRGQLVSAAFTGVPSVLMMDYEHARGLIFARPSWIMVAEPIPHTMIAISRDRLLKYPGIKEDVYVPRLTPDPSIRCEVGVAHDELMVTVRPPANEAHYHNPDSDVMFAEVMQVLGSVPNLRMVLLPRNKSQEAAIRRTWPALFEARKLIVPEHAVDGMNLIWYSDFVISGGGTMNREAAALGVPVYSIFRGKIGAVDRYLASTGRLTLLETVEDVRQRLQVTRRAISSTPKSHGTETLDAIVDHIVAIVEGRPAVSLLPERQAKCQAAH